MTCGCFRGTSTARTGMEHSGTMVPLDVAGRGTPFAAGAKGPLTNQVQQTIFRRSQSKYE